MNCWNAHGISLGAQEITPAVAGAPAVELAPGRGGVAGARLLPALPVDPVGPIGPIDSKPVGINGKWFNY